MICPPPLLRAKVEDLYMKPDLYVVQIIQKVLVKM